MSIINLLPDDYLAVRAQRRANILYSILFGVVMAGVVVAAVVSEQSYQRTREVSERVNESYAEAEKLIEQLHTLEQKKTQLVGKAQRTAGLLERVPRSCLLAVITQALPEETSLSRFELRTKRRVGAVPKSQYEAANLQRNKVSAQLTGLEVEIKVTGLATTDVQVARFISDMFRCPLMQTADLVYSKEKKFKESVVREFQVTLELKPDADVRGVDDITRQLVAKAGPDEPIQAGRQGR